MSCQHKRPGRAARLARIQRATARWERVEAIAQRRAAIVVHFPAPRRCRFSPGYLVAWADGRG